ncbi:MAG: hypothetical protein JXB10_02545 [Pirellulales bacterium]|nr:hypothetical protein [Pirellulales bacterium]
MKSLPPPTVDVQAPNGRRIVLRPVISERWFPRTSRGGLAVALVLCATWFATSVNRLNHADLWGHLSIGRWMVEHRALPQGNPFHSLADSEPHLNASWLSQLLGYLWYRVLGAEGLVLAHALLMTLTAGGLALAVAGRGVSWAWAAAAAVAFVLCLPGVGILYAQGLGMAAFVGVLWAITQLPQRRHPLFWLPLLFALWANLHGSFLVGLAALTCFTVGSTWDTWRKQRNLMTTWIQPAVAHAWLALLLSTAGVCLNPRGVWLLPATAGCAWQTIFSWIAPWRPAEAFSLPGVMLMVSLVLTVVLVSSSPRRKTAWEMLLLTGFGLLAVTSMKMGTWWALLWPWLAAPHAAALWRSRPAENSPSVAEAAAAGRWRTRLLIAVVFVTVIWSPPSYALLTGRHRPDPAVFSADTPYHLAEDLVGREIAGQIVAPRDWTDYLIWRTGGAVEPLAYSSAPSSSSATGWLALADRCRLRFLVVSLARHPGLRSVLAREPRCRVRYQDDQALLVEILPPRSR